MLIAKTSGIGLLALFLVLLLTTQTGQRQDLSITLMGTVQKLIIAHSKGDGQIFLVTSQTFLYVREIQLFHHFNYLNSFLLGENKAV